MPKCSRHLCYWRIWRVAGSIFSWWNHPGLGWNLQLQTMGHCLPAIGPSKSWCWCIQRSWWSGVSLVGSSWVATAPWYGLMGHLDISFSTSMTEKMHVGFLQEIHGQRVPGAWSLTVCHTSFFVAMSILDLVQALKKHETLAAYRTVATKAPFLAVCGAEGDRPDVSPTNHGHGPSKKNIAWVGDGWCFKGKT